MFSFVWFLSYTPLFCWHLMHNLRITITILIQVRQWEILGKKEEEEEGKCIKYNQPHYWRLQEAADSVIQRLSVWSSMLVSLNDLKFYDSSNEINGFFFLSFVREKNDREICISAIDLEKLKPKRKV